MPDYRRAGALSRIMMGQATGSTNPFTGGITINQNKISNPDEMAGIIAHEGEHQQQVQSMNPLQRLGAMGSIIFNRFSNRLVPQGLPQESLINKPYYWEPSEMAAFQKQSDVLRGTSEPGAVTGRKDIQLQTEAPISQRRKVLSMFKGPND